MSTQLRVTSLPPVQFSAFRSGTTPPPHNGHIRRHERELYGLEPWPADKPKVEPKAKTRTEKMMANAQKTLRDMPFDAACRTVKRMHAKAQAQKYPLEQRDAAEKLLNIINR